MECRYCGAAEADPVFFDSGCQVGMLYVCEKQECKDKFAAYLRYAGFHELRDKDLTDSSKSYNEY